MIRSLRKRHLNLWVLISVLLAIGIFASVWVIPQMPFEDAISAPLAPAFPEILATIDKEELKANLRQNKGGELQIELFIKKPMTIPAPALYTGKASSVESLSFVANLQESGLYRINIADTEQRQFVIYSRLKNKVYSSLEF